MPVDVIALAQLGGFATLAIVMTLSARTVFEAWRRGDLVSKDIYQRSESRADLLAGQLERNTEALKAHTVVQERLVRALERQAAALERRAGREAVTLGKDGL
jgi:hypothetical protein